MRIDDDDPLVAAERRRNQAEAIRRERERVASGGHLPGAAALPAGSVHTHPVQVYYEDTDFSGVVYHANYLKYFERAREHLLGVEELVRMFREDGIGFVVYKADLTFKEGAVHGDSLEIRTRIRQESEWRILFHQSAWRVDGRSPLVEGTLQLVCVDRNQKLVRLPQRIVEGLRTWEV